jgi:amino acid transporter
MGPAGGLLLSAGVVASVGGHLSASMFAVPRLTYRLGLDGSLPAWFARVPASTLTPVWSILFMGIAVFLLAASGSFVWLAGLSVLTRLPVWLLSVAALPRLQRQAGLTPPPGGPLLPLVAGLVCLALLSQVPPASFAAAAGFLAVGGGLFALARLGTPKRRV